VRTPQGERERLYRISGAFERGFRQIYSVGQAVTVFGSARYSEGMPQYELGREVSHELARAGFAGMTGGGPEMMEAANRGAREASGWRVGFNILQPYEQRANPYLGEMVEFRSSFVRTVMLVKYSCAFVCLPGRLGRMAGLLEAATLIQCRKIEPFPLVLVGEECWSGTRVLMEAGPGGRRVPAGTGPHHDHDAPRCGGPDPQGIAFDGTRATRALTPTPDSVQGSRADLRE
jgi:uncharacterized protein (TIGR00730 family)